MSHYAAMHMCILSVITSNVVLATTDGNEGTISTIGSRSLRANFNFRIAVAAGIAGVALALTLVVYFLFFAGKKCSPWTEEYLSYLKSQEKTNRFMYRGAGFLARDCIFGEDHGACRIRCTHEDDVEHHGAIECKEGKYSIENFIECANCNLKGNLMQYDNNTRDECEKGDECVANPVEEKSGNWGTYCTKKPDGYNYDCNKYTKEECDGVTTPQGKCEVVQFPDSEYNSKWQNGLERMTDRFACVLGLSPDVPEPVWYSW